MKESENIVSGYSFSDGQDYKEAKREAETIEYIKANTDLNNLDKTLKIYHKLVEKQTFKTVVGYEFLRKLQDDLRKSEVAGKEDLQNIRIEKKKEGSGKLTTTATTQNPDHKFQSLYEEYRIRHRNSRIINIFLFAIIAAMIIITLISDRTVYKNYKNDVLNQYATWEEELDAREKALEVRESAVTVKEDKE